MLEHTSTSIIIAVHDRAEALEKNLPLFITTAREAGAQVIVVDDMSSDDTPDVLKRMLTEHADVLYTTFLPRSVVPNPSRLRLALSVGTKASKATHIVLADINRPPCSAEWLKELTESPAALVYTNRKNDDVVHVQATDLDDLSNIILKAERKSGRGHKGKFMKRRRGLYDAVGVERQHVFEAIHLFDQPVGFWKLTGLRLKVWL